jgi:transposase, IS5 family
VAIAAMVPWESFQPKLKTAPIKGALRGREAARKNLAGRKRWDEIAVFKAPALQALDNLSGDRTEYQRRDRLSFMRFVGLGLEDAVAGAKTLWLSRTALASRRGGRSVRTVLESLLDRKIERLRESPNREFASVSRRSNLTDESGNLSSAKVVIQWVSG